MFTFQFTYFSKPEELSVSRFYFDEDGQAWFLLYSIPRGFVDARDKVDEFLRIVSNG